MPLPLNRIATVSNPSQSFPISGPLHDTTITSFNAGPDLLRYFKALTTSLASFNMPIPALVLNALLESPRQQELEERRVLFLKIARFLLARGLWIKADKHISILGLSNVQWSCSNGHVGFGLDEDLEAEMSFAAVEWEGMDEATRILTKRHVDSYCPDLFLEGWAQSVIETDSRLSSLSPCSGEGVTTPVVSMQVDIQDDTYKVALWNWLQEKPFFEKEYPRKVKAGYFRDEEIAGDLCQVAADHFASFDIEGALKTLSPLTEKEHEEFDSRRVYVLARPDSWNNEEMKAAESSWKSLLKLFTLRLLARPLDVAIDRTVMRPGWIYPTPMLSIDHEKAEEFTDRTLRINGLLDDIIFSLMGNNEEEKTLRSKKEILDMCEIYGSITDKYGNVIEPRCGKIPLKNVLVVTGFVVIHPTPLTRDMSATADITHGVDLTAFGLGDYPNLFSLPTISPQMTPDKDRPYYLYTNLPKAEDIANAFARVSQVAAQTEELFGFKPGTRINNIFFVSSSISNATARYADPTTILVWKAMVKDLLEGSRDEAMRHEVIHCLDYQFGLSRDAGIIKMYKRLYDADDLELFHSIDEKNMYPSAWGGHSEDSNREFVASLTNSILTPLWNERIAKMSPKVRGLYFNALQRLKDVIAAGQPELASSPYFAVLEGRLNTLKLIE